MNTITFATTQMNLINCVEYLSTINGEHTLFVLTDSRIRHKQMKSLLDNSAYSNVFDCIIRRPNTNSRILNFLITCFFLFRLRILAKYKKYDKVVTGNYRSYGPRLLYSIQQYHNPLCEFVVCDDGLMTKTIARERFKEVETSTPYIFIPSKFEAFLSRNRMISFIPRPLHFFTVYNIPLAEYDLLTRNHYNYIKNHLTSFNVNVNRFECSAIFLGQPLYSKNFITVGCYSNKLKQYASTVSDVIVYYAHPEETEEKWSELDLGQQYIYIQNFIPFEIIAALLPKGCRVAGFMSSALMNLNAMNNTLQGECIKLKEDELIEKKPYAKLKVTYEYYAANNIKFYEFA